jgi:aspartokinase
MPRVKGWVVVFKGEQWMADVIAAALTAQGVEAESFQEMRLGPIIEAQVMVPAAQAETARRVIRDAESKPPEDV